MAIIIVGLTADSYTKICVGLGLLESPTQTTFRRGPSPWMRTFRWCLKSPFRFPAPSAKSGPPIPLDT